MTTSSGGSAQSRSEPAAGDLRGTSDTTGVVALDQAARGRLVETDLWDTDWFAAELTAGRAYRIQVLGTPGVDCTLLAPIVESLQDASGRVVAGTEWWDESRELWSRLTFTPASDGRYYISVVGEANYGGVGTYIVALTDGGSGSDERITSIGSQGCVPEAPAGLGLSEVTGSSVTLSWTAPAHSAISGYRILRGTDASTLSVIAPDTGSTATSYVDAGVSPSTTYVYAVVALSAAGEGAPSASASTTTPSPSPEAGAKPGKTGSDPTLEAPSPARNAHRGELHAGRDRADPDPLVRPRHARLEYTVGRRRDRLPDLARSQCRRVDRARVGHRLDIHELRGRDGRGRHDLSLRRGRPQRRRRRAAVDQQHRHPGRAAGDEPSDPGTRRATDRGAAAVGRREPDRVVQRQPDRDVRQQPGQAERE